METERSGAAWRELLSAMRRRVYERFLQPIRELERFDKRQSLPFRPGFAIVALDCLLIDTIQSFREGRATTGEVSPAHSFKSFLSSQRFAGFKKQERGEFFNYVRNAILHNGETRKDWKIRIDVPDMVYRDPNTGVRTINRRLFHAAVIREWRELLAQLGSGQPNVRGGFLRRMDALAGLPLEPLRNFYFAYGSNLLQAECQRTAPEAQPYGVAFLPGYQLQFTKHSTTRGGDAANIHPDPASMVWGFIYRVHDNDKVKLQGRERGYELRDNLTVYLVAPTPEEDPTPVSAFTFLTTNKCPKQCGSQAAYLQLIVNGAKERGLPEAYQTALAKLLY
jgi:hypothetical protein